MREVWERDVQFNRARIRDSQCSAWPEVRKWRRRFWVAAVIAGALAIALLVR